MTARLEARPETDLFTPQLGDLFFQELGEFFQLHR